MDKAVQLITLQIERYKKDHGQVPTCLPTSMPVYKRLRNALAKENPKWLREAYILWGLGTDETTEIFPKGNDTKP